MTKKKALVTGGSRGLGFEIAQLLAAKDYCVTVIGRESAGLEAAIRAFPGSDHQAWTHDLSQPASVHELIKRLEDEPFELLINNAGASRFGRFSELPLETVEELIYLNLTAPALISRQFLINSKPGATLVNVTSIVATTPIPGNSLYCAAKAGLKTLSECLWYEARSQGVRVLDFRPVTLKTDFHRAAGKESLSPGGMAVDPRKAAMALVRAVENGRDFAYPFGVFGRLLEMANRIVPRKFLVTRLGRKAAKDGYLKSGN